jgi:hypothetical protein
MTSRSGPSASTWACIARVRDFECLLAQPERSSDHLNASLTQSVLARTLACERPKTAGRPPSRWLPDVCGFELAEVVLCSEYTMWKKSRSLVLLLMVVPGLACGGPSSLSPTDSPQSEIGPDDLVKPEPGKEDSSYLATVLDFEWDGELETDSVWNQRAVIQDQLLYTIGHLNANKAVGRLDKLELSNVRTSEVPGGKTKLAYHIKMPVAWGSKTNLPKTYSFRLPRDVSNGGTNAFTDKYKATCVDWGAHDVDPGSMWYYYRPDKSGCSIDAADIVPMDVKVSVSASNTTGKYPEYHKVWEDQSFKVVSVFGKYEDGATSSGDGGIAAYNEFVQSVTTALAPYHPTTIPAALTSSPGVAMPDIQFDATLPSGNALQVNALLVDNVAQATASFYDRYEGLSTRADLIAYNGHAGLGQNVRALARRGRWTPGQYVVIFMNGCDTFAYVDGSLAQTRAAINPDDPSGTKYMDIVTNAMPAYFSSDADATMAVVKGLLAFDAPLTYEQIFKNIDYHQIVLVTGEEDNTYVPGQPGGNGPDAGPDPTQWDGMKETGTVPGGEELKYSTPNLPAGTYLFKMTGSGDADLYVRVGTPPTASLYDCRPYKGGSNESCTVDLPTVAPIHVMIRGYAASSTFDLVGSSQ